MHTILIVDDEERLRKALGRSLSQEGHQTLAAASAEEALGLLNEREIDLVITDLVMTGMDGIALVKRIKHTEPGMKVIIITAYGSAESMQEAEELGVACYLAKPFDLSYLKSIVNALLPAGKTPELSCEPPSRAGQCQGVCCLASAAAGRTLGWAAALPRRILRCIRPANVMFALGRTARTVFGLPWVFRTKGVDQE